MNVLPDVSIELSSRCTCACPKCPRTLLKGSYDELDLPLSHIQTILDTKPDHISLLGNLGDPIYHESFPDIIQMFGRARQRFTVFTIGSGFGTSWWHDIYASYDDDCGPSNWIFSVDGTSHSAGIYRKGLIFRQSFDAMRIGAALGKNITWHYIVFSHNQDDIAEARRLCAEHNIFLKLDFNDKWDGDSDVWKPTKTAIELGL